MTQPRFPGQPDSPLLEAQTRPAPEAGRSRVYQSSDERSSSGPKAPRAGSSPTRSSTDAFGLARTVGPYDTLDAAKAAAEASRDEAPADNAAARSLAKDRGQPPRAMATSKAQVARPSPSRPPHRQPTWLEKLEDDDREAARTRAG